MNFELLERALPSLKLSGKAMTIESINPPETMFGFTYHAHCIPPFKPQKAIVLGCAGLTVNRLIKLVWGQDAKVGGIDSKLGHPDVRDFIKETSKKYDYICIDLWNEDKVCDFIYRKEFADRIKSICSGFLCMNVPSKDIRDKALVYSEAGFTYLRHDIIEENAVIWWKV